MSYLVFILFIVFVVWLLIGTLAFVHAGVPHPGWEPQGVLAATWMLMCWPYYLYRFRKWEKEQETKYGSGR